MTDKELNFLGAINTENGFLGDLDAWMHENATSTSCWDFSLVPFTRRVHAHFFASMRSAMAATCFAIMSHSMFTALPTRKS
jgi:hypothetical protein